MQEYRKVAEEINFQLNGGWAGLFTSLAAFVIKWILIGACLKLAWNIL